jgi:hypothetical protein
MRPRPNAGHTPASAGRKRAERPSNSFANRGDRQTSQSLPHCRPEPGDRFTVQRQTRGRRKGPSRTADHHRAPGRHHVAARFRDACPAAHPVTCSMNQRMISYLVAPLRWTYTGQRAAPPLPRSDCQPASGGSRDCAGGRARTRSTASPPSRPTPQPGQAGAGYRCTASGGGRGARSPSVPRALVKPSPGAVAAPLRLRGGSCPATGLGASPAAAA